MEEPQTPHTIVLTQTQYEVLGLTGEIIVGGFSIVLPSQEN